MLLGGMFAASQFVTNGALGGRIGLGKTVLINSIVGFVGSLVFYLLLGLRSKGVAWTQAFYLPWNYYIGGFLGAGVVACAAYAMPRLGGALTVALFVFAQTMLSAFYDARGVMGLTAQPLTLLKVIGALFLTAGVLLLRVK
ncbi:MAG: DMT family transporter [Elusimicrobiota bacterium]